MESAVQSPSANAAPTQSPPAKPAHPSSGPEWWDDGDEDSSGLVEVLTMPQEIADELAAEVQARAADLSLEVIEAGFWARRETGPGVRSLSPSGSGFGSGEVLDTLVPGPSLAGMTDAVTGDGELGRLDDDELIGVLRAWRRLESWSAAGTLSAVAELARRRPAERTAPAQPTAFPEQMSEFLTDEIGAALTLTAQAANGCLDLALDLAIRLPETARALREGRIDYLKARLIAEALRALSDEDARTVEGRILPAAGQQTTGQLRVALARAVLAVDPAAAERRREQAQKDPRVRRWREDAGTAALAGYGLPPADVLEADQYLTSRALDLRDAGLAGSLDQLRARAYLDAILGRNSSPSAAPAPCPDPPPRQAPRSSANPGSEDPASGNPAGSGPAYEDPLSGDPANSGLASGETQTGEPVTSDASVGDSASSRPVSGAEPASGKPGSEVFASGELLPSPWVPQPGQCPPTALGDPAGGRLAARVNLTMSLSALLGLGSGPAEVAGFGPIDPDLARQLSIRAAAHPATRWCLTVTDDSGRAIGHGCMPGRRPAQVFGDPGGGATPGPPARPSGGAGPVRWAEPAKRQLGARELTVKIAALAQGTCDHQNQEPGYEPSRRLQHLIRARSVTCSAPGCCRPAARCDLDHTVPYEQGGLTCECDLAPLCRHHHRCKQAEGWRLEQPEPGVLVWRTPAGRTYITTPSTYPVS